MHPRFRTAVQLLLAGFGVLLLLVGAVPSEDLADGDRPFVLLVGGGVLVAALLWRLVSRNSAEPDVLDGPVPLGDGRRVPGQKVTMPRSKRVALGTGGMMFAAVSGWMAVSPDAGTVTMLVGWAGVAMFGVAGAVHLRNARHQQWLGFSDVGLTLCATGGHFTVPWDEVRAIGVHEMSHRGAKSRYVAIDFDVDAAVGRVSRTVRAGSKADLGMPTLLLPSAMFDMALEDIVGMAGRWQHEPTWPDSPHA